MALVKRTRATLRSAEFGFFGVCVYTRMQTPRFSGQPMSAGDLVLDRTASLPMRTSCENVGTVVPLFPWAAREKIFPGVRRASRADTACKLSHCAHTKTREHTLTLKGHCESGETSKKLRTDSKRQNA